MKIAIITGASSGLGRAYARELDKSRRDIAEFWLVARRAERLEELAGELDHDCRILALDLGQRESTQLLGELLQAERPEVAVLINAAGFGKFGRAEDLTEGETADMIDLNCRAAAELTRLCVPYLHRDSRVLEVASCAGFQPLPGLNVYAATKAFLLHYSRALRRELKDRGVKVTAVCPYWIKTEFIQVARQTGNPDAVRSTPFAARPEAVAAWSLSMNALNAAVVTCGPIPTGMRLARKLLPTGAVLGAWDVLRKV